ncbi:MAG: hypothetical protein AAF615_08820, partial [Pseudomonadota bacterium]
TLPEWLYAKMVSGYSPLVTTVGILTVAGSALLLAVALTLPKLIGLLRRAGQARLSPAPQERYSSAAETP